MLEAALSYLAHGWSVIPVVRGPEKRPAIAWKPYQTRRPTEAEVRTGFATEDMNIGLVTGAISGRAVLDCESPETVWELEAKGFVPGPMVQTGRGFHLHVQNVPGQSIWAKHPDFPELDFRGEGGYAILPPSIHHSGKAYTWVQQDYPLPVAPAWLFGRSGKSVSELVHGVAEGGRQDALPRVLGHYALNQKHLNLADIVACGMAWNAKNTPPLSVVEIESAAQRVYDLELAKRNEQTPPCATTLTSLWPQIQTLYTNGLGRGLSAGWMSLDPFYTVQKGQMTLVTGIPSHGKSTFVDNVMVNLCQAQGWQFAIFSAENYPHARYGLRLAEIWTGQPFVVGPTDRGSVEALEQAITTMHQHITLLNPPESALNVRTLLAEVQRLKETQGIDGFILDPWNELDHTRPNGVTETEYISSTLTTLRRFARTHDIHIWLVAHPAKMNRKEDGTYHIPTPYDISGSAHWRNKADMVLTIWRDDQDPAQRTTIHVQKVRFRECGAIGKVDLRFISRNGRFAMVEDAQDTTDRWDNKGDDVDV